MKNEVSEHYSTKSECLLIEVLFADYSLIAVFWKCLNKIWNWEKIIKNDLAIQKN